MSSYILDDAGRKIVEENCMLVPYVVAKYYSYTGMEIEDLISIGNIGLCKAAATYNPKLKNRFSTYATTCIINTIRMEFRKELKHKKAFDEPIVSLNQPQLNDDDVCELIDLLVDTSVDIESQVMDKILCESIKAYIPTYIEMQEMNMGIPEYARLKHLTKQGVYSRLLREFRRARDVLNGKCVAVRDT